MNDLSGMTVQEMCSRHATSPEDYSRSCNPDGTVKSPSTTKITLRNDPSNSLARNNTLPPNLIVALIWALVVLILILIKIRRKAKSRSEQTAAHATSTQKPTKSQKALAEGKAQRKYQLKMSVFLALFGCALVALGVIMTKSWYISSSWERTTGTFTNYTAQRDSRQRYTYTGIATYEVDGQQYTVKAPSGSSEIPSAGGRVEIAYNPAKPSEAKIPLDNTDKYGVTLLFAFGIFALFLAYINFARPYLLRREQNKKKRNKSGSPHPTPGN